MHPPQNKHLPGQRNGSDAGRPPSLLLLLPMLLSASGCDVYGLPAYQQQEQSTPRPIGDSAAGILDIDPKLGRAGETVEVTVIGLKTSFTDQTTASFPADPDLTVKSVSTLSLETLRLVVVIGERVEPGVKALEITSPADGTLAYAGGFTVVQ